MKNILIQYGLLIIIWCSSALMANINAQQIKVKSFQELQSDLSARTNRRYDLNDEPCALIKVQFPASGATFDGFVVGDAEYKANEYWVYVSPGAKRLKLHMPGFATANINFEDYGIKTVEQNMTYILVFDLPENFAVKNAVKVSFYGEVGVMFGCFIAPTIAVGTNIGYVNVEFDAMLPISSSDNVYWAKKNARPLIYTYKPSLGVGARIGYCFNFGDKIKLTPQVGVMYMKTSETPDEGGSSIANGANNLSSTFDLKFQYFPKKKFGIFLAPEYDYSISRSNGMKEIIKNSSKINKWNNSLVVKLGVNFVF